jgi:AcrR family transcriptional regulator
MGRDGQAAGRIALAALRLLEAGGPEKVTMRRVARAAGLTAMAIYHHFPNRQALLAAVAEAEFAKIVRFFDLQPVRGGAGRRLCRLTEAYLQYAFARPRLFDYIFAQARPGARRFPKDFREPSSPLLERVAAAVALAMDEGWLKKDNVAEVALALWAHVHGHVALYRAGRIDLSQAQLQALFRRSLRRFLAGLRA